MFGQQGAHQNVVEIKLLLWVICVVAAKHLVPESTRCSAQTEKPRAANALRLRMKRDHGRNRRPWATAAMTQPLPSLAI